MDATADPMAQFLRTADALSRNSSYSRYYSNRNERFRGSSARPVAAATSSSYNSNSNDGNSRHVNWDDLGEEEEPDEDDDQNDDAFRKYAEQDRARVVERKQSEWRRSTYEPAQQQLDEFWTPLFHSEDHLPNQQQQQQQQVEQTSPVEPNVAAVESAPPTATLSLDDLSWTDFFMPPYHPKSRLYLPTLTTTSSASAFDTGDNGIVQSWDNDDWSAPSLSYYEAATATYATNSAYAGWRDDELEGRLRWMLEDCDSCQGIVLTTSSPSSSSASDQAGDGIFAGLSTHVLQYMADECPSARRWVLSTSSAPSGQEDEVNHPMASSSENVAQNSEPQQQQSWRTKKVLSVRRDIERGLSWHDHVELSHAILPLELPNSSSLFTSSAYVGAALETATLPYRLSRNNSRENSLIGLNSYYYGSFDVGTPFGTTSRLSFADFLSTLKPSTRHSVFELDALLPSSSSARNGESVWLRLREGTSVERDPRMPPSNRSNSSGGNILPGAWLLQNGSLGGILSQFSPTGSGNSACRSQHNHFSLSAALRPAPLRYVTTTQYVTCLMEGIGIRYRPEQSMACTLNQSLGALVRDGYAAGSYWKHIWDTSEPVLSALGNTTRIYPHLSEIAVQMKDALSPKSRGYYSRDAMSGVLPEADDCEEAVSFCYDLRDVYRPPEGSGLADDEEGSYFDDD